jgi:hypothetical protein
VSRGIDALLALAEGSPAVQIRDALRALVPEYTGGLVAGAQPPVVRPAAAGARKKPDAPELGELFGPARVQDIPQVHPLAEPAGSIGGPEALHVEANPRRDTGTQPMLVRAQPG